MIRWQPRRSPSARLLVAALMTVLMLGGCGPDPSERAARPIGPPPAGVRGSVPRPDHTILRTVEDAYQLPPLGAAAATPPITGIWAP